MHSTCNLSEKSHSITKAPKQITEQIQGEGYCNDNSKTGRNQEKLTQKRDPRGFGRQKGVNSKQITKNRGT